MKPWKTKHQTAERNTDPATSVVTCSREPGTPTEWRILQSAEKRTTSPWSGVLGEALLPMPRVKRILCHMQDLLPRCCLNATDSVKFVALTLWTSRSRQMEKTPSRSRTSSVSVPVATKENDDVTCLLKKHSCHFDAFGSSITTPWKF